MSTGTTEDRVLQWVGGLPERWETAALGTRLKENKSSNKGLLEKQVLSLSYGRVVVKPEEKLRGLVPESFETYQILEPGDIVIRPTDLQNDQTSLRIGQSHFRGIITSAYIAVRPQLGMNHRYAAYMLAAYDFMKVFYGFGSGLRQNLDFKHIKHIPIPVPSPEEQALIVRYLDDAELRIAKAIGGKSDLLRLLDEQRFSVVVEEVLGRSSENAAVRGGLGSSDDRVLDWIGAVPSTWPIRQLAEVVSPVYYSNVGLPETRVLSLSYGRVVVKPEEKLRGLVPASFETYQIVDPGDIIIRPTDLQNDRTSLRVGQVEDRGIITSAYMALRPHPAENAKYVMLQLAAYDFMKVFYGYGAGLRQNLDYKHIKHIPMVIPSRREQDEIVQRVEVRTSALLQARAGLLSEIALLKEYRTRLISDVVTGKVDVREEAAKLPEIDPAELAAVLAGGAAGTDEEEAENGDD